MRALYVGNRSGLDALGLIDVVHISGETDVEGISSQSLSGAKPAIIVDTAHEPCCSLVKELSKKGVACDHLYLLANGNGATTGEFLCDAEFSGTKIFFFSGASSHHRDRLKRVLAIHETPAFLRSGMLESLEGRRIVEADSFDLPEIDVPALEDRFGDLTVQAFEAAELLIGDLTGRIEGIARRVHAYGRRDFWVLWEQHLSPVVNLVYAILDESEHSQPDFYPLRRARQAEALLTTNLMGNADGEKPDFQALFLGAVSPDWTAVAAHRRKLNDLNQVAFDTVRHFLNAPHTLQPREVEVAPTFENNGLWARVRRHTELASAHKVCRRLCGYLSRIMNLVEFRDKLMVRFAEFVWSRNFSQPMQRLDAWTMLAEAVRPALRDIRGSRVVLGVTRSMLLRVGESKLRSQLEAIFGVACFIVTIDNPPAWFYYESKLSPMELLGYRMVSESSEPSHELVDRLNAEGVKEAPEVPRCCPRAPEKDVELECSECCPPPEKPTCSCEYQGSLHDAGLGPVACTTCPKCGRYNRRLWWQCCRHGKVPVDVSVADDRCPDCILRHHGDPARYPLSSISIRPDLLKLVYCPHCSDLHCRNKRHHRYRIPEEILPYYWNGVAACELEDFRKVAALHGLHGDFRCPSCRTILIPIHHREGGTCEDTRAGKETVC